MSEELLDKYVYYAREGVALTILSPFLVAALPFAIIGYMFTFESYEEHVDREDSAQTSQTDNERVNE